MNKTTKNFLFLGIGLAIIIVLSILAYTEYIKPMYENNVSQEIQFQNRQEVGLILKKKSEQDKIFSLEFEISPNPSSNYTLRIANTKGVLYEAKVKKGVEYVYKTDWYEDQCILDYIPDTESNDQVKLSYRFLGMN